jgi:hypothetical protein
MFILFYAPSRGRINNLHAKKRAKVLRFFGLTKYFRIFLENILKIMYARQHIQGIYNGISLTII